jgi:hypothetical protein
MRLLLTVGPQPFRMTGAPLAAAVAALEFAPRPILPAAWFTRQAQKVVLAGESFDLPADAFACAALGRTLLVYHNPLRRDTFGLGAVHPRRFTLHAASDAVPLLIEADAVGSPLAEQVRSGRFRRIDVELA